MTNQHFTIVALTLFTLGFAASAQFTTAYAEDKRGVVPKEAPKAAQATQTTLQHTLEDRVVAAVIIGEAGGESVEGRRAVMHTINNRAKQRGQTHYQVVTAKWQFSCLNGIDPQAYVALKMTHSKFQEALALATDFRLGNVGTDPTHGASHYHTPAVHPYWTAKSLGGKNSKARITLKLGGHVFLAGVDD